MADLGHQTPTPVQAQAIPPALQGRDLLAAAQTGTGKTAAFALSLLQRLDAAPARPSPNHIRALILVPVRELAEQVHQAVRQYGERMLLRSAVAYGGVSINPQMMALRRGVDILVATPGRLLDLHAKNAVRFAEVQTLVLDEADRMLDLGFADELDQLLALLPRQRQTLLFSATFSDEIRTLAQRLLRDPVVVDVAPRQLAAVSVEQWAVPVDKRHKGELLVQLLRERNWPPALVFAKTRQQVDRLTKALTALEIPAEAIHGDRSQPARLRALQRFRDGSVRILVATDVAARGLHIEGLPLVVNVDLPIVAEDYVHRIGRTGRAGEQGQAISLVCADEVEQLRAIEQLLGRALPRRTHPEFEPDHRVPATGPVRPSKPPRAGRQTAKPGNAPPARPPSQGPAAAQPEHRFRDAPDQPAAVPAPGAGRPALQLGKPRPTQPRSGGRKPGRPGTAKRKR